MSIREEFEKWYSNDGDYPKSIERDESGQYKYIGTASAWVAYRAGVKLQSKKVEELQIQLEQERLELNAALESLEFILNHDDPVIAVKALKKAMEGVK